MDNEGLTKKTPEKGVMDVTGRLRFAEVVLSSIVSDAPLRLTATPFTYHSTTKATT
jgi:hypothetical protein